MTARRGEVFHSRGSIAVSVRVGVFMAPVPDAFRTDVTPPVSFSMRSRAALYPALGQPAEPWRFASLVQASRISRDTCGRVVQEPRNITLVTSSTRHQNRDQLPSMRRRWVEYRAGIEPVGLGVMYPPMERGRPRPRFGACALQHLRNFRAPLAGEDARAPYLLACPRPVIGGRLRQSIL